MNLAEIRARVQAESDARFGETIEKLLLILRQRHTHQCWKKECWCDYCRFINGTYVDNKLLLHKMKKRLAWYEYHHLTFDQACSMMSLEMNVARQIWHVKALKGYKKELQKDIL